MFVCEWEMSYMLIEGILPNRVHESREEVCWERTTEEREPSQELEEISGTTVSQPGDTEVQVKFQIDSAADVSIVNEKIITHLGVEAIMKETDTVIRREEGGWMIVRGTIEWKDNYREEEHVLKLIVVTKEAVLLWRQRSWTNGNCNVWWAGVSKY